MCRKRICSLLLLFLVLLAPIGCADGGGDWFAPLRGGFSARVAGEWNGVAFEGRLVAAPVGAQDTREMTLSFYAPSALCATEVKLAARGTLTLCADGLSIPLTDSAAQGYLALFSLFSCAGEVREVLQENGNTRVNGTGFSLLFAQDGAPLAAENATVRIQISDFVREGV